MMSFPKNTKLFNECLFQYIQNMFVLPKLEGYAYNFVFSSILIQIMIIEDSKHESLKRNDFHISIVKLPFLSSNLPFAKYIAITYLNLFVAHAHVLTFRTLFAEVFLKEQ